MAPLTLARTAHLVRRLLLVVAAVNVAVFAVLRADGLWWMGVPNLLVAATNVWTFRRYGPELRR